MHRACGRRWLTRSILLWMALGPVACNRDSQTREARPAPIAKTDLKPIAADDQSPPQVDHIQGHRVQAGTKPSKPIPAQIFRPDDQRPKHDDAFLAQLGIRAYESKHLKLYSDIEADIAETLPRLADQAYAAMERDLGTLPPARSGADFQVTCYLMRDMALFREHALVPEELFIEHGLHRGQRCWMRDQTSDYYRRHLLIHEMAHCFMTIMPDVRVPVWYLEGVAESFGTHRSADNGDVGFRLVPAASQDFPGFGRIELIRNEIAAGRSRTLPSVTGLNAFEFREREHYAWAWALCTFLQESPHYHDHFQQMIEFTQGGLFDKKFQELILVDRQELFTEWRLCTANLMYGYDFERAAIEFVSGTPFEKVEPVRKVVVNSAKGWQSSRLHFEAGLNYEIEADGQFTLADDPKPWLSEPQGISFQYFDKRPLGMLLGCIKSEPMTSDTELESMLDIIPIGRRVQLRSKYTGTLYLRINDAWNSLKDNRGNVEVSIRAAVER